MKINFDDIKIGCPWLENDKFCEAISDVNIAKGGVYCEYSKCAIFYWLKMINLPPELLNTLKAIDE